MTLHMRYAVTLPGPVGAHAAATPTARSAASNQSPSARTRPWSPRSKLRATASDAPPTARWRRPRAATPRASGGFGDYLRGDYLRGLDALTG